MAATQQTLTWAVVGQGAIGLLAACRLKLADIPVILWLRQPQQQPLPVSFTSHNQQHYPLVLPTSDHTEILQRVFIPVKAYDAVECIQQLLPYLATDAQLVLSHNGMGTIEQILSMLKPQHGLWFLSTSLGAMKSVIKSPTTAVQHTGEGKTILAPLNQAAAKAQQEVTSTMQAAFPAAERVNDIQPYLWQKLAVNAVINPLTAILNCRNGDLLQQKYRQQITELVNEVCATATATGYTMQPQPTLMNVLNVAEKTAANFSSMQQDIAAGRRTEVDYITGYLLQQAARFKLELPLNKNLLQQIKVLQARYGR